MRRRTKLWAALFLIIASAALVLWNTGAANPSPALGVSDAKWNAHNLDGQAVTIRGNVVEGSILEDGPRVVEFVVADSYEQLRVVYNQTPPDNFGAKEVVLKGAMTVGDDGVPVLQADSIQVGCASKY